MSSTKNAYDLQWKSQSAVREANVLSEKYRLGTPDASSDIESLLCWTSPHPYIQVLELHDSPMLCVHAYILPKPEFFNFFQEYEGIVRSETSKGMFCIKHTSYANILAGLDSCVKCASEKQGKQLHKSDLMELSRDNCPGAPIKLTRNIQ